MHSHKRFLVWINYLNVVNIVRFLLCKLLFYVNNTTNSKVTTTSVLLSFIVPWPLQEITWFI